MNIKNREFKSTLSVYVTGEKDITGIAPSPALDTLIWLNYSGAKVGPVGGGVFVDRLYDQSPTPNMSLERFLLRNLYLFFNPASRPDKLEKAFMRIINQMYPNDADIVLKAFKGELQFDADAVSLYASARSLTFSNLPQYDFGPIYPPNFETKVEEPVVVEEPEQETKESESESEAEQESEKAEDETPVEEKAEEVKVEEPVSPPKRKGGRPRKNPLPSTDA